MKVSVHFYSYFKDLAECADTTITLAEGSTLDDLFQQLTIQFPKLAAMRNCALIAIGVDYQSRGYILKPGDEVSLFPPVQGG